MLLLEYDGRSLLTVLWLQGESGSGAKSARPRCFDSMSHVTVRPDYPGNRTTYKPVWTQVNDTRAKGLIDHRPGKRVRGGHQPFALIL